MSKQIICFRFFNESSSPKPLKITLESFRIFSKIRGDIRKSRCNTDVNYTSGIFATGINNTGGKFATVITPAENLPLGAVVLVPDLPPVTGVVDTGGK
jgi:hypothetical protein